jgi:hypothetical protein
MSSTSWNLFPLRAVFSIGKTKNILVRNQENRVGGLPPQHRVWPEMSSLPVQNVKGHCHTTRTNRLLLEIVASPRKCTSAFFRKPRRKMHYRLSALQAQIICESHLVCQKMWSAWCWAWTFANETFWALVMTLRSIACSEVSSLSDIEVPMTHPKLQ